MAIDITKPTDDELVSTHAGYIRETRAALWPDDLTDYPWFENFATADWDTPSDIHVTSLLSIKEYVTGAIATAIDALDLSNVVRKVAGTTTSLTVPQWSTTSGTLNAVGLTVSQDNTASSLVQRTALGNAVAADPTDSTHLATKKYVDDNIGGSGLGDVVGPATPLVNGIPYWTAASPKTLSEGIGFSSGIVAERLVRRDAAGRAQVTTPNVADDIATKGYVDGKVGPSAGDVKGPASSTDSAVALFDGTTGKLLKDGVLHSTSQVVNTLVLRDPTTGRAEIATPTAATEIANKAYVDAQVAAGGQGGGWMSTFIINQNTTFIVPYAGKYRISGVGGAGGGGAMRPSVTYPCIVATGGGGGAFFELEATLAALTPVTVVIGEGGIGAVGDGVGVSGSDGGDTSVSYGLVTVIAGGGYGGNAGFGTTPILGGLGGTVTDASGVAAIKCSGGRGGNSTYAVGIIVSKYSGLSTGGGAAGSPRGLGGRGGDADVRLRVDVALDYIFFGTGGGGIGGFHGTDFSPISPALHLDLFENSNISYGGGSGSHGLATIPGYNIFRSGTGTSDGLDHTPNVPYFTDLRAPFYSVSGGGGFDGGGGDGGRYVYTPSLRESAGAGGILGGTGGDWRGVTNYQTASIGGGGGGSVNLLAVSPHGNNGGRGLVTIERIG